MANSLDDHIKIKEVSGNFRDYLIPPEHPRLHPKDRNARAHAQAVLSNESIFLVPVARAWLENYNQPYKGFTSDGIVSKDIWHLDHTANGPTSLMAKAAQHLISCATAPEAQKLRYAVNAREWRSWSNPEVIIVDSGLRMEEMNVDLRAAVNQLLQASLSPEGYQKVKTAMLMNAFLGELTTLTKVMNADSYHFCLFGEPARGQPWGFNLFGHHLCLNVFTLDGEIVIGPFFIGAEPNFIDTGPHEGLEVLNREEAAGFAFMRSLSVEQRRKARLQGDINDIDGSTMPCGRWNPADLRGLGGAHQDNRVVPYEGLCARDMTTEQRKALLAIVAIFNDLLPKESRALFMNRVEQHLDSTYFAWIGPLDDNTPFYYRVHGPVVMDEFDHHNGVWLANALPKKYHIHTMQRLPNRGDYGTALYDEWRTQTDNENERV